MKTLFEKIWDSHVAVQEPDSPAVLAIDLHLIHEVTTPQAFAELAARGIPVRRPEKTVGTMDHSTPTSPLAVVDSQATAQLETLRANCAKHGIELYALESDKQGIVHVIGPELGLTQPGMTVVCGDSHTSTHGAFGALAFGIGTSEVAQVLATQCVLARRPKTLEVRVDGPLAPGVTAKDVILALIAQIGTGGATGHVIEYTGSAIRGLDMEGRMTVCNMSIEAGARAGMIGPDDTTFQYLAGREAAPKDFEAAVARWRTLASDEGAQYDRAVTLSTDALEPMITWGTNPGMGVGITRPVPRPESLTGSEKVAAEQALAYMALEPGKPLLGHRVDVVFLGSCTNSRIGDLRAAARVVEGRKVAGGVRMLVVPGSKQVQRDAEAEGLDRIFKSAGAEWREPGCSMCIAMNGDSIAPGEYAVSTSNRNFEGRQGPGGRTFLASPVTAAAAAVSGMIVDPRELEVLP